MVRSRKTCQFCVTLTVIICSVKVLYFMRSLNIHSQEVLVPQPKSDRSHEVIQPIDQSINYLLYWGKRWGKASWPPEGWLMDDCVVTYNRSRIQEAKAIVFHSTTILPKDFPWQHDRFGKYDQIK